MSSVRTPDGIRADAVDICGRIVYNMAGMKSAFQERESLCFKKPARDFTANCSR